MNKDCWEEMGSAGGIHRGWGQGGRSAFTYRLVKPIKNEFKLCPSGDGGKTQKQVKSQGTWLKS